MAWQRRLQHLPTAVGVAFLLLQLGLMIRSRVVDRTLPYWAPNDFHVDYRIAVALPSGQLSPLEVFARYDLWPEGVYEYPPDALLDIVRRREAALGTTQPRRVTIEYRLNGRAPITSTWSVP